MTDTDQQTPTFGRLARRTFSTFMGALGNRAELFAVEFAEENDRMLRLVMFGVAALLLGMMTVLLVTGVIIFLVPEEHRVWAALGFSVLYLGGTVAAGLTVKNLLKQAPFSESLNQIRKDSEILDAFK